MPNMVVVVEVGVAGSEREFVEGWRAVFLAVVENRSCCFGLEAELRVRVVGGRKMKEEERVSARKGSHNSKEGGAR